MACAKIPPFCMGVAIVKPHRLAAAEAQRTKINMFIAKCPECNACPHQVKNKLFYKINYTVFDFLLNSELYMNINRFNCNFKNVFEKLNMKIHRISICYFYHLFIL